MYSGSNASIKDTKDRGGTVFVNIFSILISIISAIVTGLELIQGVTTYSVILSLIIAIVVFGGVCYFVYINSIPLKLNKEYQCFLRKNVYKEIKSAEEIFWWN